MRLLRAAATELANRPPHGLWQRRRSCAALLVALALPSPGAAQFPPAGPITTAGGRLTISGEAAVSISPEDPAYFNYSTAAYNLLRLVRFDGSADLRVSNWFSLLGDVRVLGAIGEGGWSVRPYALFARIRPWSDRAFDIQAGLVPPVFGAFSRRGYGADTPLIGFPLAYQYVTSLRPDALPATADDLLARRGRGWRVRYPVGDQAADHGVPLMDGLRYPIGVEMHGGSGKFEAAAAVTTGSLAVPDGSVEGSWQASGRAAVRPAVGLVLGGSVSRGIFLDRALTDEVGTTGQGGMNDQRAVGFDVEYSRGYWLVRAEGVFSSWRVPRVAAPYIDEPLRAFGLDVEGRYRILPGLSAAVRIDRLGFSDVTGSTGRYSWEAAVWRVEAGGSYAVRRNVLVKGVYQYNWRDTSDGHTAGLVSAQLLVWF
jgi:hypothetical protein